MKVSGIVAFFRLGLILIMLFALRFQATSQSLYQIQFHSQDAAATSYNCLLVYFNENDCHMRVGYTYRGTYYVVETQYTATTGVTEEGMNYFFLMGSEPKYLTESNERSYNPDYFIWLWDNGGEMDLPWVTDDPDFNEDKIFQCDSYTEVTENNVTDEYLRQFYYEDEREYLSLRRMFGLDANYDYNYDQDDNNYSDNSDNNNTNTDNNNYNTNTNPEYNTSGISLHLIIAANIDDPDIGYSCALDKNKLVNEFKDICKTLNIKFYEHSIAGDNYSKSTLVSTLSSLDPGSNDVVIFYYTGHGFRWEDQTSDWPMMHFPYSRADIPTIENSLGLGDVYSTIVAKGARLNLIFGDCCNSGIGYNQISSSTFITSRTGQNSEYTKLYHLFVQAKGNVISTAASPGEVSWSNSSYGGYYTASFLQSLNEEVSYLTTETADWSDVIDNAIDGARYKTSYSVCQGCTTQNGIKRISVTY